MWNRAPFYRLRAEEARRKAALMREGPTKLMMLRCAEQWEAMARKEEERKKFLGDC